MKTITCFNKEQSMYEAEIGFDDYSEFQDPGGNSALRLATRRNPRNLPCPTCKQPNRLTAKDKRLQYQCDSCADREEGCGMGGGY